MRGPLVLQAPIIGVIVISLAHWACTQANPNAILDTRAVESGAVDVGICGASTCGACPPSCAGADRCVGGQWQCECECPPDGGRPVDGRRADSKRSGDGKVVDAKGVDRGVVIDGKVVIDSKVIDRGPLGPEDCQNGVDDNGDGLVDCDDPQCKPGYQCVASAPSGWIGVGWINSSLGAVCPPPFLPAVSLFEKGQLSAPAATCACGCGAPGGTTCNALLRCVAGAACATVSPVPLTGTCSVVPVPAPNGQNSCSATLSAVPGNCTPAVKTTVPPYTWPAAARGCLAGSGGKCATTGQVCIARMPGSKGPCIARSGDAVCPAPYVVKIVYFDGKVADTRGCGSPSCSCGPAQGTTCGCAGALCGVTIHASNACQASGLQPVPLGGACVTFNDQGNGDNNWGAVALGVGLTSAGSCPSSGAGTPFGAATPSGPVTVCCAP